MNAPLKVSLLITADASGVAGATGEAKREVQGVGQAAKATSGSLGELANANDQAASAATRAMAAARGQAAAERDLRQSVAAFAGLRSEMSGQDYAKRSADITAYGNALDQLRSKYNPVFAASKAYEQELNELNRALSLGAITAREHGDALQAMNARYAAAGQAAQVYGQQTAMAKMQTTNLAYQFQDIGTMMAMGQNPFMLLAQQLPQVTMHGGRLNGVMGALRSTVGGLLSPLGFLTTAFVLAGSAAVSWFSAAEQEAKSLEDTIDGLSQSVRDFNAGVRDLDMKSLKAEFGDVTTSIIDLQEQLLQIRIKNIMLDAADAVKTLAKEFDHDGFLTTGAMRLGDLFSANLGQIAILEARFRDLGNAQGFDQQYRAISAIKDEILNVTGGLANMTREQADFFKKTVEAEVALRKAEAATGGIAGETGRAADEMSRFATNAQSAIESLRGALSGKTNRLLPPDRRAEVFNLSGRMGDTRTDLVDQLKRQAEEITNARRRRERASRKPPKTEAERSAERYQDIIRQAEQAIDMQRLETEALYMTEGAADKMRQQQILLNQAKSAGIKLTPRQTEELMKFGAGLADVTAEFEKQSEILELRKDMWQDVIGGLSDAAKDGKVTLEELGEIGMRVLDRLIDKIEIDLVDALSSLGQKTGSSGGGNWLSMLAGGIGSLFGFGGGNGRQWELAASGLFGGLYEDGGYTGPGARNETAGYVHKDEFVFSSPAVRTIGVGTLDRMHQAAKTGRGFADGGYTGSPFGGSHTGGFSTAGGVNLTLQQITNVGGVTTPAEIKAAIADGMNETEQRIQSTLPEIISKHRLYGEDV